MHVDTQYNETTSTTDDHDTIEVSAATTTETSETLTATGRPKQIVANFDEISQNTC